jgi:hypothetical protein
MPSDNDEKSRAHPAAPPYLDLAKVPLEEPEDGVFTVYSNLVNMDWTLYDVRLRFAELIQVPDDEAPFWGNQHSVVLERAMITLPWHQAKTLCSMLAGLIQSYETLNGELKSILLPGLAAPNEDKK